MRKGGEKSELNPVIQMSEGCVDNIAQGTVKNY